MRPGNNFFSSVAPAFTQVDCVTSPLLRNNPLVVLMGSCLSHISLIIFIGVRNRKIALLQEARIRCIL